MSQDQLTVTNFIGRFFSDRTADEYLRTTLSQHLTTKMVARGEYLVRQGTYHRYTYFLTKGSARSFYLKDGTEVNTWFAFEEEIVGSFQTYLGKPARENIQAMEESEVIVLDLSSIKTWAETEVRISNFVRLVVEEYTMYLEEKLLALQMTATERYRYLVEREPEVLRRVPLTYVASYLGISRETLSRIRSKIVL